MKKAYLLVTIQFALLISLFSGPVFDHHPGIKLLGAPIFLFGLALLLAAFIRLGRTLTPSPIPRESGKLKTTGVYAFCRHPVYVGLFFMGVGYSLYYFSIVSAVSTVLLSVLMNSKASFEEGLLLRKYGEEYEAYKKRVKKFYFF